jgi:homoserine dehydrogenase
MFQALAGAEFRETNLTGNRGLLLGYNDQLQTQLTSTVNFNTLSTYNTTIWSPGFPVAQVYYPILTNDIGVVTETKHRYASAMAQLAYTFDSKYNFEGSVRKDYAD